MVRWVAVLMAGVLASLAGGCGSSPEDDVRSVMRDLQTVQSEGDAELGCREVFVVREHGEAGAAEAEREAEGEGEEGEVEAGDCERAVGQVLRARRAQADDLESRVGRVSVEGDEAKARMTFSIRRTDGSTLERAVDYELVKTEEGWRVPISPEG